MGKQVACGRFGGRSAFGVCHSFVGRKFGSMLYTPRINFEGGLQRKKTLELILKDHRVPLHDQYYHTMHLH